MDYRKSKLVPVLGYLYLVIPVLIFCFGWLRWYYALFVGLAFLVCGVFIYRRINPVDLVIPRDRNTIIKFASAITIIVLIMILSGIANNSSQSWDMYWRNTIFTELVNEPWPASMTGLVDGKTTTIYLVYYIGFYLPPALMGKMFGMAFGFASIAVWASMGITIIYLLLCSYMKKISIWPLIIFLFFSGFDYFDRLIFLPNVFTDLYEFQDYVEAYFYHLEWIYGGVNPYSIPSNMTQLYWTFNQAIPLFVLLSLVFLGNQEHDIIFFTSLIVLTSTLSCFGVALIIVFMFFLEKKDDDISYRFINSFEELKENLKKILLNPSLILAVLFTFFTGLYVLSNTNINTSGERGFWIQNPFETFGTAWVFFTFIFFEVVIFFIYSFKYQKKNPLLYLALIGAIIPLHIRLNSSVDIMLKVSTPFMFIFALMFIFSLKKDYSQSLLTRKLLGMVIVMCGSITGIFEIMRLFLNTYGLYRGVGMVLFAYSMDILIVAITFSSCFAYCYYIPKIENSYLSRGCKIIIPIVSCLLFSIFLSLVVSNGIKTGHWTSSCEPWEELYLAYNFSGSSDALFFKLFSR